MVLLIAVIVYVEIWGQNWGLVKVMFGWLPFPRESSQIVLSFVEAGKLKLKKN